jgi:uncharacterized protein
MTKNQIIRYTKNKVKELFKNYPVPAHGFNHVKQVRDWAIKLARAEQANLFLCEMSAWLHDVGRTLEKERDGETSLHHELSYNICQEWFKKDSILKKLPQEDKIAILYSVRYHWNNAADKFASAIILRDADKLDLFGYRGLKRAKQYWGAGNTRALLKATRYVFSDAFFLHTKTARAICKKEKLVEPIKKFHLQLLKKQIKKVSL